MFFAQEMLLLVIFVFEKCFYFWCFVSERCFYWWCFVSSYGTTWFLRDTGWNRLSLLCHRIVLINWISYSWSLVCHCSTVLSLSLILKKIDLTDTNARCTEAKGLTHFIRQTLRITINCINPFVYRFHVLVNHQLLCLASTRRFLWNTFKFLCLQQKMTRAL